MACIIEVTLYIHIRSIWPAECWLWALCLLGPSFHHDGLQVVYLKDLAMCMSKCSSDYASARYAHLLRHANRIHEKDQSWFTEHRNWVTRYDTTWRWGYTQLLRSTKSLKQWVRPNVEKDRVCLYDKMRWKWDDVYLLWGQPDIYSPSLCPPPLPLYLIRTTVARWQCTWKPWSGVFGDALGYRNRVNSEILLEAEIERV